MKKLIVFLALFIITFVLLVLPRSIANIVVAANSSESSLTTGTSATASATATPKAQSTTKAKISAQAIKGELCKNVETRISTQTARFDNNKDRHITAYKAMKERITSMITLLNAKGYDTGKIKTDLAALDTKITKFSTDYVAYVGKLKESQSYACGQSEGMFKNKLSETKTLLRTVQQDSLDIRNFYQTTIKPDIQALKKQKVIVPSPTATSTSNTNL